MRQQTDHLIHDGLMVKELTSKKAKGLFATQNFKKGEVLVVFGGRAATRETINKISPDLSRHALQIGKNLFLLQHVFEDGEYINHSCDPNLGFEGQITLVAIRDIEAGEEVCFDYAMVDMSDADEFNCLCSSPFCRKKVTGEDWRLPDLKKRYKGYFGAHVQRAIDELISKE